MRLRGRWLGLSVLLTSGGLLYSATGCDDLCVRTGTLCKADGGDGGAGGGGGNGGGGAGGAGSCVPPLPGNATVADQFPDDGTHWIAKDLTGECANISSWVGRRLFKGSIKGANPVNIGGKMATYCAYKWNGALPLTMSDIDALPVDRAGDRRAITAQTAVDNWAQTAFLDGIQPHDTAPLSGQGDANPRVRVLVLDTEGDSVGEVLPVLREEPNHHGLLMASLVRDLACPDSGTGTCTVEVETRLALPHFRNATTLLEETVTTGGDYGRITDLAEAVNKALSHWRDELDGTGQFPEMLVLNLSLAFEGQTDLLAYESFLADDLILDALGAFWCHGGVTFAAAGNHGGAGSTDSGLLYPAAWQDHEEPSELDCKALLDIDPTLPEPGQDSFYDTLKAAYGTRTQNTAVLRRTYLPGTPGKLLHGIGAFDAGGVPITKTRENACPRYGALGLGWSVSDQSDFLLTGTSVSTAVVSGLFAAAMAQDTFLGPQNESFTDPYLNAHPETILAQLAPQSQMRPFGARGPCGDKDWYCPLPVAWIGKPEGDPATMTQNPEANFPLPDYSELTELPSLGDSCLTPPLCERPTTSAVSLIFPTPTDVPCIQGCFVDMDTFNLYINPAMAMTYVKLLIELPDSKNLIDVTADGQVLARNAHYKIALGGASVPQGARVSLSALALENNKSITDQVLLVEPQQ